MASGLFSRLFDHSRRHLPPESELLEAAIERAVQRVEPRLRQIGDYPRRYRRPVAHALDFTDLHGRDRRRWTVVLVRCHPRPELLSMAERLREASRWLQL